MTGIAVIAAPELTAISVLFVVVRWLRGRRSRAKQGALTKREIYNAGPYIRRARSLWVRVTVARRCHHYRSLSAHGPIVSFACL